MKYLPLLILSGLLVACSHTRAPSKPVQPASLADCENVYQYIVTMTVRDQIDTEHHFSKAELEAAAEEVDQEYISEGSRARFLASCQKSMTTAQVECSLQVKHLDGIHTCVTLIH